MVMDILAHPFTLVLLGCVAFIVKDIFLKSQTSSGNSVDIEALKERIVKLESQQLKTTDLAVSIVRLEEQVKRLAEDIKYLLEQMRADKNG
jgi:hypothetical protein